MLSSQQQQSHASFHAPPYDDSTLCVINKNPNRMSGPRYCIPHMKRSPDYPSPTSRANCVQTPPSNRLSTPSQLLYYSPLSTLICLSLSILLIKILLKFSCGIKDNLKVFVHHTIFTISPCPYCLITKQKEPEMPPWRRAIPNVPTLKKPPAWVPKVEGDMLLGKVKVVSKIGLQKTHCLQVLVPEHRFFEFTQVFYRSFATHWTLDPESKCGLGDVVLIRKASETEQFSSTVPYIIDRIVFQYGNVVDPITHRRNHQDGVYEDEVLFRKKLIEEVYNEPLADDSLSHESKRHLIKRKIEERRTRRVSGGSKNVDRHDDELFDLD